MLWAALALGVVIRAAPALVSDFPLNDGGMFAVMIRDVQQAGLTLPRSTSYNDLGIPFAYPPLAFLLAAVVASLAGMDPVATLRVLPPALSILALLAFALLAYDTVDRLGAAIATMVFAVLPGAFAWEIMGGGLTRALGMLLAILALREARRFYVRPSRSAWLRLVGFSAGTVLTHLDWAAFLAVSMLAVVVAYVRNRAGLMATVGAGASVLVITSLWWATAIQRYGPEPFLAASQTGSWLSLIVADAEEASRPVVAVVLLALVGLVTLITAVPGRAWLFVGWCCLIAIADYRAYVQLISIPAALGAGCAVAALAMWVLAVRRERPLGPTRRKPRDSSRPSRSAPWGWLANGTALVLIGAGLFANAQFWPRTPAMLAPLSQEQRWVMAWIAASTPDDSRFLIVPSVGWALDRESEWFPALALRHSIVTVQGTEWVPGLLPRVVDVHTAARRCATEDSTCLDRLANERFTHVLLPRSASEECCPRLIRSLQADSRYELLLDHPGGSVFRGPRSEVTVSSQPGNRGAPSSSTAP